MNQRIFERIQVAIGMRICLSHKPSANEWGELYAMAKKHSLVGVCFVAAQRLQEDERPPEMLYPTNDINEVEIHYPIFPDTEVEIY